MMTMAEAATARGFTQQSFDAFLASRAEQPQWLIDQRREAWETFLRLPMPSMQEEEWRRTDIRLLRLDRFGLPSSGASACSPPSPLLTEGVDLAGLSTSVNSILVQSQLQPEVAAAGVLFGGLDELAVTHSDLVRAHLGRAFDPGYDKFAALNTACFSGGTMLYVPRGVSVERPLHVLSAMTAGGVDLGRLLVVLEEDAQATLLTETASAEPGPGFHCGGVELLLAPGARLRFVGLQNWDHGVWHFAHQKAIVDARSRLQWTIGALGARLAKVNQRVVLDGEGADVEVSGVMFAEDKQHLAYNTHQHHRAPRCQSDLLYKAALKDKSHTVWRGMILVDPEAQKTDAYQRNDNLLLSEHCRADSIPGLEIEADDVRCTHGATAGQVDDEQIFYAQTRGLTHDEATRLVVSGFFQQVLDRITIENVRHVLGEAVGRRIRQYK